MYICIHYIYRERERERETESGRGGEREREGGFMGILLDKEESNAKQNGDRWFLGTRSI